MVRLGRGVHQRPGGAGMPGPGRTVTRRCWLAGVARGWRCRADGGKPTGAEAVEDLRPVTTAPILSRFSCWRRTHTSSVGQSETARRMAQPAQQPGETRERNPPPPRTPPVPTFVIDGNRGGQHVTAGEGARLSPSLIGAPIDVDTVGRASYRRKGGESHVPTALPRIPVLPETRAGQALTDALADVAVAARPDAVAALVALERQHPGHARISNDEYTELYASLAAALRAPAAPEAGRSLPRRGMVEVLHEISRRARAAAGVPDLPLRGRAFDDAPVRPFPLPPIADAAAREAVLRTLQHLRETRPDLLADIAEEERRQVNTWDSYNDFMQVAQQFLTTIGAPARLRREVWAAAMHGIVTICDIPTFVGSA